MKKVFIWATIPFLFLSFYGIQLGLAYHNSNLDCDILKENRKEWMQCSRKKRIADRNIRRFWDGY